MFQLNEDFLNSVGLYNMPAEQKKPFLQHIYQELELRVGTKLSEGMSDDQLIEFESIVDQKADKIENWLQSNAPDYISDETFKNLQAKTGLKDDDIKLVSEYAASKWLEKNRPDYRDVVNKTMEELRQEITANRDTLLKQE